MIMALFPGIFLLVPYFSWLPSSLTGSTLEAASGRRFAGAAAESWGIGRVAGCDWRPALAALQIAVYGRGIEPRAELHRLSGAGRCAEQDCLIELAWFSTATRRRRAAVKGIPLPDTKRIFVHYIDSPACDGDVLLDAVCEEQFATQGTRVVAANDFFPAVMAYLILILLSPAYNSFAFEGRRIQSYFMKPRCACATSW